MLRLQAFALALINAGSGASYLLGGPASAPSLRLLQEIMPIQAWGAALVVTGVLVACKQYVAGHCIGLLAWAAWAVSSWASLLDNTLTGASGPWTTTGIMALHMIGLWWRNNDRQAGR